MLVTLAVVVTLAAELLKDNVLVELSTQPKRLDFGLVSLRRQADFIEVAGRS